MKIYLQLLVSFFKTGLFTFGGGLAMLPIIKAEVVDRRKWITEDELLDFFALSQCTPGIIIVNVATFCGYRLKGVLGGIASTLAVITPSVLVITLIAAALGAYMDYPAVKSAFAGIRICTCALLLNLIIELAQKFYHQSNNRRLHGLIFVLALCMLGLFKATAIWVIIMAAAVGLFFSFKGRFK